MKKTDLDRLEEKIDRVIEKTSSIDVTLAKQSVILDEHVRRTNLLEKKLEPIEKHVILMKGLMKIVGFVGLGALLKFLHTFMTS